MDKLCNLVGSFLVFPHMARTNHLDTSYSLWPRNRHRQNKILLEKKYNKVYSLMRDRSFECCGRILGSWVGLGLISRVRIV